MTEKPRLPFNPFDAMAQMADAGGWRKTMTEQVEKFWQSQTRILDEYETLSRTLVDRRRAATEATLKAAKKMGECKDMADWLGCYNEWVTGSLSRLTADNRDVLEEGMKVVNVLSQDMSAFAAAAQAAAKMPEEQRGKRPPQAA